MPENPTTTTPTPVDPSNADQARSWDGAEGAYWADHDALFDAALAAYQPRFAAATDVQPADRVLDIGCGTGLTTRAAARSAPDGHALGIDLSSRMIDRARQLAASEDITNARFVHGDAQTHPFPPGGFDLAISRTGSMFFGQPAVAFASIARALRPGGRLVLLTWQPTERNEWLTAFAAALTGTTPPPPPADRPGPFSLSDPERVRSLLGASGFDRVDLVDVTAPMAYGTTVDEAHGFVLGLLGWMLDGRDEAERRRAEDRLRASLEAHAAPGAVQYASAAWLVTAHRP